MYEVQYQGPTKAALKLDESPDMVVVRTRSGSHLEPLLARGVVLRSEARSLLRGWERVVDFNDAGVTVLRRTAGGVPALDSRDALRRALKAEPAIRFAGRVLTTGASREPIVYTENLFVKFRASVKSHVIESLFEEHGLAIKSPLRFAPQAFFVGAREGTGQAVFEIARRLLEQPGVECCHPELVRRVRRRAATDLQWHLQDLRLGDGTVIHANVDVLDAWKLTQGEGTTIAVIDDGVDVDHPEFRRAGKIVAPRHASFAADTPHGQDPRPGAGDDHGTACAGVACADGLHASGVAPRARLMPIRLTAGLGSIAEAEAFFHAASRGADVISCSWGPPDGAWYDPSDPVHQEVVPLPDSTRLAIEYATDHGRGGRGCVITWAAGNGGQPTADNDGYASCDRVIAVAACNDSGFRSVYSESGACVWCCFPSSDPETGRTPGIYTTDRVGHDGYNPGNEKLGDPNGDYTNDFGGTSSACPGAAGTAALILARNPSLGWRDVKDLMRQCCERIDAAGGAYGADGHSKLYGYGRLNAARAAGLAMPQRLQIHEARQPRPIHDNDAAQLAVEVADSPVPTGLRVRVDIEHKYIGDLVVTVRPPVGPPVTLHNREGGGKNDIKHTYDADQVEGLAAIRGRSPQGRWTLNVEDRGTRREGVLRAFAVELSYAN